MIPVFPAKVTLNYVDPVKMSEEIKRLVQENKRLQEKVKSLEREIEYLEDQAYDYRTRIRNLSPDNERIDW